MEAGVSAPHGSTRHQKKLLPPRLHFALSLEVEGSASHPHRQRRSFHQGWGSLHPPANQVRPQKSPALGQAQGRTRPSHTFEISVQMSPAMSSSIRTAAAISQELHRCLFLRRDFGVEGPTWSLRASSRRSHVEAFLHNQNTSGSKGPNSKVLWLRIVVI